MKQNNMSQPNGSTAQNEETKQLKDGLRNQVEELARQHAGDGMPLHEDQYMALGVHSTIEVTLQEALTANYNRQVLGESIAPTQQDNEETLAKIRTLNAEQSDRRRTLAAVKSEVASSSVSMSVIYVRTAVHVGMLIGAAAEGALAFDGFRNAKLGLVASVLWAFGVGVAVASGAYYGAEFTRSAASSSGRWFRAMLILAVFGSMFSYIGIIRAGALNAVNTLPGDDAAVSTGEPICWCTIAGLSFGLFLIAFFLELYIWRDRAAKDDEAQYFRSKNRLNELTAEHAEASAEIASLQAAAASQAIGATYGKAYASTTESDLLMYGKRMQELYRDVNLRYRSDGIIPPFFARFPAFIFVTYYGASQKSPIMAPAHKAATIALALSLLATGCSKPESDTSKASCAGVFLTDLTDTFAVTLDNRMFRLFDFQNFPDQRAQFRISAITDKEYNPVDEFTLPDGATTEKSNVRDLVDFRILCIRNFGNRLSRSLGALPEQASIERPCRYSHCYWQIANQLEWLAKAKADRKFMCIASDLFDKSPLIDIYSEQGFALLSDPTRVARIFEASKPLPESLTGIQVFVFYRPVTRFQDQVFRQIVAVYRLLLEPRGATLHIQTSQNMSLSSQ